jgi:UDP-2,4-diacetamido-2,4,6-trideoxy-beta-L-altropyranose hydrolase
VEDRDARLLLRWRNERSTLKNSFNANSIPWSTHEKWLQSKSQDSMCHLLILEYGKKPIGHVRVDILRRGTGEIHINLDKNLRGRGLGSHGISVVSDDFLKRGIVKTLLAHIKPENISSIVAFLKAGFRFDKQVRIKGLSCYRLTKKQS